MTVYAIVISLVLALPWGLFGLVLLGAPSSAVARWIGRPRSPYRARKRGRSMGSRGEVGMRQAPQRRLPIGASMPLPLPRAHPSDRGRPEQREAA